MAFETRIPTAAASEFDSDDVDAGVVMGTPSFGVNTDPVNLLTLDYSHFHSAGRCDKMNYTLGERGTALYGRFQS
jgi:hypothetical protein